MAIAAPSRGVVGIVAVAFGVVATVGAATVPFGAVIMGLLMSWVFRSDPRLKSMFALLGGGITVLLSLWMIFAPTTVTTHIGPPVTITQPQH